MARSERQQRKSVFIKLPPQCWYDVLAIKISPLIFLASVADSTSFARLVQAHFFPRHIFTRVGSGGWHGDCHATGGFPRWRSI
jgi:hypothetical protein